MRCVFPEAFDQYPGLDQALAARKVTCAPSATRFVSLAGMQSILFRWQRFLSPLHAVGALLAPADCRVCALPLTSVRAYPVCDECLAGAGHPAGGTSGAACYLCGDALGMEPGWGLARAEDLRCDGCRRQAPAFRRAVAFGHYGGVLRTLIHLHKFKHIAALAEPMGERLAEVIGGWEAEVSSGLTVVAVPLFRRRRPFNQSAAIADVAVRRLRRERPHWPLQVDHRLLRRTRATESQSRLTPAQRRDNVRGAFTVAGDVRGRAVLLVDDVYTTGATVAECTRVLLRAGANSVRVATLARATRELVAAWEPFHGLPGTSDEASRQATIGALPRPAGLSAEQLVRTSNLSRSTLGFTGAKASIGDDDHPQRDDRDEDHSG